MQLLTKGNEVNIGRNTVDIPSVLSKAVKGIRERLMKTDNRKNAGDYYEVKDNRLVLEIPTLVNKSTDENEHHKVIFQPVEELDKEKLEALKKSARDRVSGQRESRKFDSVTVFIFAEDADPEVPTNKLLSTGTGKNHKFIVWEEQPLQAIKNAMWMLHGFYRSRAKALERREKVLQDTVDQFTGYFGDFGRAYRAFVEKILTMPEKFLNALNMLFKAINRAINQQKSVSSVSELPSVNTTVGSYLDKIT